MLWISWLIAVCSWVSSSSRVILDMLGMKATKLDAAQGFSSRMYVCDAALLRSCCSRREGAIHISGFG